MIIGSVHPWPDPSAVHPPSDHDGLPRKRGLVGAHVMGDTLRHASCVSDPRWLVLAVPAGGGMSAPDLVPRLQELAELRESGVVEDGEYALAKAMLLGGPPPAVPLPGQATFGNRMARPIEVAGYGMPVGLPVLVAVFVGLVLLAAVLGSVTSG
jgi:hypothetical protein